MQPVTSSHIDQRDGEGVPTAINRPALPHALMPRVGRYRRAHAPIWSGNPLAPVRLVRLQLQQLETVTPDRGVGMSESPDDAMDALRDALDGSSDPVRVSLVIPRSVAEKLLDLLAAEHNSGAIVVPVREFCTTTESASMLGISRASLMKLIESGELGAIKVGTHHRVPADELLAYQRARQVSRERASENLSEFSARSANFQSNVTFGTERSRSRRVRLDE